MKTKRMLLALATAGLLLTSACGAASSQPAASQPPSTSPSSAPAPSAPASSSQAEASQQVYRGQVTEAEDGRFTVEQLPGYDYGQPAIVFLTDGETLLEEDAPPETGMYVEVLYDGRLTKSIPPQATAQSVEVLAAQAEGAVLNGTIQKAEKTKDGYTLELVPLAQENPQGLAAEPLVILNLPAGALENLSEAELTEGTKVSAVTLGIATASLPPQVPVAVLLPYAG